jgi:hypothetical protein
MENASDLVPFMISFCITAGVFAGFYWSSKARESQQETLRQVIASGQKLDETTLKLMVKAPNSPEMDLRSGLICLSMGLGFGAAGGISKLNFDAGFGSFMIMIGVVLAFTGAGQLLSWYLRRPAPASDPQ